MEKTEQGVALIGLGAVIPDAPDVPTAWANFVTGHSAIRPVPPEIWDTRIGHDPTHRNPDQSYSAVGAVVRGFEFDPQEFGLPPVAGKHLDPGQQVALIAARQALRDAGIEAPTGGLNAAVILGDLQGGTQMRAERWLRTEHPLLEKTIAGLPVFADLASLELPVHIVNIVTPPAVTLGVLAKAAELGLPNVWLQDGSFDDAVLDYAATAPFKTVYNACIMVVSNF